MKYAILIAAAICAVVAFPASAAKGAGGGSCSVSPQQVPLGGSYTFTATGLIPNALYQFQWDQAGPEPEQNGIHGRVSDANGNISSSFTTDFNAQDPLEVGWVKIKIRPVGQGTSQPVTCGFEVVP